MVSLPLTHTHAGNPAAQSSVSVYRWSEQVDQEAQMTPEQMIEFSIRSEQQTK